MSQDTESMSITILEKEQYPEFLQKIKLFAKSEKIIINRTAFNFKTFLIAAINDKNNEKAEYLKDGIENVIKYFSKELLDLINNYPEIRIELVHLELLNDISEALLQQISFNNIKKLDKFKQFLLSL